MRRFLQGLSIAACVVVGTVLAFDVATLDAPVYFGFLHGDYPDPDRPGHLKGVVVSAPELLGKTLLALALLAAAWFWQRLPKSNEIPD